MCRPPLNARVRRITVNLRRDQLHRMRLVYIGGTICFHEVVRILLISYWKLDEVEVERFVDSTKTDKKEANLISSALL